MTETTPMVAQYREIKGRHKDAILFFRLGDFYEMFNEDAEFASRELDLTLTGRGKDENRMPMCGLPYHAADGYIGKLIEKGHKVAICEQVEDPSQAKGLVKRDVIRIYTPGTVLESSLLSERKSNYLLARSKDTLAYIDVSTGEFMTARVENEADLKSEIDRIAPVEILHSDSPVEMILDYLKETRKTPLGHIGEPVRYMVGQFMRLDQQTRRNLELTETIRDRSFKGSLLWVLDRCLTSMGSRLLQRWVLAPLLDKVEIEKRLTAVEELFKNALLRAELSRELNRVFDIERLTARTASGAANARDLISLAESLTHLPRIAEVLKDCKALEIPRPLPEVVDIIKKAIVPDPPFILTEGGLIKEGYNAELDELKKATRGGKSWITELENRERARTGIKSLKVGYTKVFGYYIEVSNSNLSSVPAEYIRKQTLVNCERFITPELKDKEAFILNAEERLKDLEYKLFCDIRSQVAEYTKKMQAAARALAELDVFLSLAEVAVANNYCRPTFGNVGAALVAARTRHPVVEKTLGEQKFTPNDVTLKDDSRFLMITGPNMAGKCVSCDTLVFTNQGLLPISQFNSPAMKTGEFKPLDLIVKGLCGAERTSHLYKGGHQKTIRIRTRSGFVIEGTENHRVIARDKSGKNEWKRLDKIGPFDYLVIDRDIDLWGEKTKIESFICKENHHNLRKYKTPTKMTKELAYLMGLLIGDGTLTYREYICFSNIDKELIDIFKKTCIKLFGKAPITKNNGNDHLIASLYIRQYMEHLGLRYWNSKNKEVPGSILRAPREIVKSFIKGVFDTDGCAGNKYGTPSCSTSSYKLARQLQMLLLNFGMICNFRLKPTSRADNYILSLYGVNGKHFYDRIGFGLRRKNARRKLMTDPRMTNLDVIPYLNDYLVDLQKKIVGKKGIPARMRLKHINKISGIFYSYLRQGRNPSYLKLGQLIDYCRSCGIKCKELQELFAKNYFYDKVEEIAKGQSPVYDFTVPRSQAFIANGFINHNSTYMRQTALISLMAQVGSFVPAQSAELSIVDRIFTRIGAMDDIFSGQSTFMLEMTETANILNNATEHSLIILDEIGRGTATFDGMSIAAAVAEYIHQKIKAKTLFATHYHEITQLAEKHPGMKNLNVLVKEQGEEITFLHKIADGPADKSYGIAVAKLAGLPPEVVRRAREVYNTLEMVETDLLGK